MPQTSSFYSRYPNGDYYAYCILSCAITMDQIRSALKPIFEWVNNNEGKDSSKNFKRVAERFVESMEDIYPPKQVTNNYIITGLERFKEYSIASQDTMCDYVLVQVTKNLEHANNIRYTFQEWYEDECYRPYLNESEARECWNKYKEAAIRLRDKLQDWI